MATDLYRMAVMASARAYAPYSGFRVGAALCTKDGRTYCGCNVENVSFPEGWCAETTAIGHMIMDGGGSIAELAVYADKGEGITPCGGCRQRIAEFGLASTKIHLCGKAGIIRTVSLAEMLPLSFQMGAEK